MNRLLALDEVLNAAGRSRLARYTRSFRRDFKYPRTSPSARSTALTSAASSAAADGSEGDPWHSRQNDRVAVAAHIRVRPVRRLAPDTRLRRACRPAPCGCRG